MARLDHQLQIPKKNGDTQCSCPPFECLCSKNYASGCRSFSSTNKDDPSSYGELMPISFDGAQTDCSVFQAIDKVLEDVACSYGHSTSYRLAAKVASDFDQAYYSSFADGYDAEIERMNQSFYPSCDIYHNHSSIKQNHHIIESHLLLPPPPLLHHLSNGNEDMSSNFSDDCPLTPVHQTTPEKTDMFPTFPEIEDVIHPSDILVLDQPLRKPGTWVDGDGQTHQQVILAENYGHQSPADEDMKDDYVVTSLDDPDVSQRFFAAIDNLLLQDYGNGENFIHQSDGARESEKCDQIQPSWDTNPSLTSFFGPPQHPSSSDLGYSSEYTEATSKDDPFLDHTHHQELKMTSNSFSPAFSAGMQQASVVCGRGLELPEPELILPHRTSGQPMPF
ncbi:unnamed protein product [Larinioides sclopetarius]